MDSGQEVLMHSDGARGAERRYGTFCHDLRELNRRTKEAKHNNNNWSLLCTHNKYLKRQQLTNVTKLFLSTVPQNPPTKSTPPPLDQINKSSQTPVGTTK